MKNSGDNVFEGIPTRPDEASLFGQFIEGRDLSPHTVRAFGNDLRKIALWYVAANTEPFEVARVTTRDVVDFREFLHSAKNQAVATVNRALVSIRRYMVWLREHGHVASNPAEAVKELRVQQLAPKGLERPQVRKLLREVELRGDVRASAVFSMFMYTGCRVSDLAQLEVGDMILAERSGTARFRFGKGGKQRNVPLPLNCRKAVQGYLEVRPPVETSRVFVGERGPITDKGIRALCRRYSALVGFRIHPHLLRHTMAHQFLRDTNNDLVALAQILGHENLNTTARYSKRTADALAEAADRLTY